MDVNICGFMVTIINYLWFVGNSSSSASNKSDADYPKRNLVQKHY